MHLLALTENIRRLIGAGKELVVFEREFFWPVDGLEAVDRLEEARVGGCHPHACRFRRDPLKVR